MEELEIPSGKLSPSAQRVIDHAIQQSRRLGQTVTGAHILAALASVEWDAFSQTMREAGLDPLVVLRGLEADLQLLPNVSRRQVRIATSTKLALNLALQQALRAGRRTLEPCDLFSAVFEETQGPAVALLRRHGVDPAILASRIAHRARDLDQRQERLRKRFDLPSYLRNVATNLNLLARLDRTAPVFGRDSEIQRIMEILCHRERSNSVMLIGEPGVGKTAIVEGLARRIELTPESVPPRLRQCQVVNLQMNALVAGTMLRGTFEDRVQNIIRETKENPSLILFVDEAHTMVGAGSALGAPSDAANMFKSALARGEIRMIAATTRSEYKEHIQDDEALARRFRTVLVAEPTVDETRQILYSLRPRLEHNYSVRLLDDAIETSLEMSARYQRHLHLPDKVIGWLDTAAVRAELVQRADVSGSDVIDVISDAAQIPRDMVFRDVGDRFATIEKRLGQRVVGQRKAVEALARRLVLNKGPLKDGFDRPDGVLLFLGPTGVGKTELAKAVAEFLFGDEKRMIRIDMSEYQDGGVSVSKLIGMPRGIVGSERGGILTTQLRDNPCTVVLLDEIEKASRSLLNLFLQAFDEGWLTDGRGKRVYLSDAVVIMTSNVGSGHFRKLTSPMGYRSARVPEEEVRVDIHREFERTFPPEFRNRIDEVVVFQPLTRTDVRAIAVRYLDEMSATLGRADRVLTIDPDAIEKLVHEGHSLAYGARFLKRVIDERIKVPISQRWKDAREFHVIVRGDQVVVDTCGRQAAAPDAAPLWDDVRSNA